MPKCLLGALYRTFRFRLNTQMSIKLTLLSSHDLFLKLLRIPLASFHLNMSIIVFVLLAAPMKSQLVGLAELLLSFVLHYILVVILLFHLDIVDSKELNSVREFL